MPTYHVERSIRINAPLAHVKQLTTDFNEWPVWSPWLCMEPDAKLEFQGTPGANDHGYKWSGELVGAGEMQTSSIVDSNDRNIQKLDLTFLKPFRSKAKVELHLQATDAATTDVSWHMDSALPFFMFFMTDSIKSMIGMDYERGLRMLKEYAETGKVDSNIEIAGIVDVGSTAYAGLAAQSSMAGLAESMQTTFPKLDELATQLTRTEIPAGSIYNDMNLKKQLCRYTAIIPTDDIESVSNEQGSMISGTISPCKAIKVIHRGSYANLGNAWGAAMSYQRYNKHKMLKSQPPFEYYMNDPGTTPESDLVTEIYVPVRG